MTSTSLTNIPIAQLPPETLEKAARELNEPIDNLENFLIQFKILLEHERNLHGCLADGFLLRFLRAKKFNLSNALRLYRNYYKTRLIYADVFHQLRPSLVLHVFQQSILCRSPLADNMGRLLLFLKPSAWDPSTWPCADLFRAIAIIIEEMLLCAPSIQVHGINILIDLDKFSLRHASRLVSPQFLHRVATFIQGSTPLRVKSVHIVNEPALFHHAFASLKPLLKPKNRDRVMLHGTSLESLHRCIPPHLIPGNCGLEGLGVPIPSQEYIDILMSLEDYFVEHSKYGFQQSSAVKRSASCDSRRKTLGLVKTFKFHSP